MRFVQPLRNALGLATKDIQYSGRPPLPHLVASTIDAARNPNHVREVDHHLQTLGILKVTLQAPDNQSRYLEHLVLSLHKSHGHGPPITHSSTRGWFWDVRPNLAGMKLQSQEQAARSETMNEFPWHTDCSYEASPPRFFALHVLQPDQCGGGTLSVVDVANLLRLLSPSALQGLTLPEFLIKVPPEFRKGTTRSIVGCVLGTNDIGEPIRLRFREDILTPLTARAESSLTELKHALLQENSLSTLHLTPKDLPKGSVILMDNTRWLHGRSPVRDPARHLRRVRWDARPFEK
ncbi:hypothetical protein IFM61606_10175 [Aspergillus udagawae]|uniref:TauD/TfdA-like domain-containing protein n=1 Tax=Aspergillus udagawae TaxID=91492 RepID=A0ABQ1B3N6_9EURO|nr:hypothetical protein IFM61606_10175 [Aspergillus udagawae]GFF50657.1 hypothetical protein IFM51744_07397 [Aspergillus udagawae]GFF93124.1 hypothetical protein IFM53868_07082 [Aspergillus udagawae]GFG09354.1 hypothetical protein IFM5058_04380 [Aspergillus udagawae]